MNVKWAAPAKSSGLIIIVALVMLGSLWFFVWQHIENERERVVLEASRETMNLAKAFEEHVRNIVNRADDDMQLLKTVFETERPSAGVVGLLLNQAENDPARHQLGIVDEYGKFAVHSDPRLQGIGYVDRDWFSVQRMAKGDRLFVGKTVVSRSSGKAVIPLSRRINKPDGSFGGVVYTGLDTDYFADVFTRLELSSGSLISLNGMDGTIRFRQFEGHRDYGQQVLGGEIWKLAQTASSGSRIAYGVADGIQRLFAYRVMQDYPLFIVVASPLEIVMQPFEQHKNDYVYGAAGLSVIVIALALLLIDRTSKQKTELSRLQRNADIQAALREIADASLSASSQYELYAAFYRALNNLFPGLKLNIALVDEAARQIFNPYFQADTCFLPQRRSWQKGLTEYTIQQNRTVLLDAPGIDRLHRTGEVELKIVELHQWLGAPLRDSQGKIFGILSVFLLNRQSAFPADIVEITTMIATQLSIALERRKAEAALVYSEGRLNRAQAIAHVGNWEYALADGMMYASAETYRIYGIDSGIPDTLFAIIQDCILPADRLRRKQASAALLENRQKYDIEFGICRRNDGQERILHSIAELEEDEGGTPQKIIGVVQDITERKQLEAAYIVGKLQRANEIQQDAQLAARVQKALLTKPKASEYLEIAEIYKPSGYIGGDLYFLDWRYHGNLLRGFLIDAAGQGMATALHTASLHALLRELNEQDLPLSAAMRWLNKKVLEYFEEATFTGALNFEFDLQTRMLRWTCVGFPAFLLATKAEQGRVECADTPLGIDGEEDFAVHTMAIDEGDAFYFLTNGMNRLVKESETLPLQCFAETVAELQKRTEIEALEDDAAALCIKVSALPQSPVRQDGWPKVIRFQDYGDYQRLKGEVGKVLAEVTGKAHSMQEVAVHEALANAMECRDGVPRRHRARIRFNKVGNRLIVRVKSSRMGFAGNAVLRRLRSHPEDMFSFGEDASMGRGIPIMLSTTHKMTYNSEGTELLLMWNL